MSCQARSVSATPVAALGLPLGCRCPCLACRALAPPAVLLRIGALDWSWFLCAACYGEPVDLREQVMTLAEGIAGNAPLTVAAAKAAIASTGAASIKDMGKVVNALKAEHAGQMDFAKASAIVKGLLAG